MSAYGAVEFIIALMGSIRIIEASQVTLGPIDDRGVRC